MKLILKWLTSRVKVDETLEYAPKALEKGLFTNLEQYANDSEGPSDRQAPEIIEPSWYKKHGSFSMK